MGEGTKKYFINGEEVAYPISELPIYKFTVAEKEEPWWEPCELSIEIKADTPELRRAIRKLRWDNWLGLLRLKVKAFFEFWKWYLAYCRCVRKNYASSEKALRKVRRNAGN